MTVYPSAGAQIVWLLAAGDFAREEEILNEWPLSRAYRALHCWYVAHGIPVTTPDAAAREAAALEEDAERIRAMLRRVALGPAPF